LHASTPNAISNHQPPPPPPPPLVRYLPDAEREKTKQALELAHRVHDGQNRRDGSAFITHPVAVAKLVASWGMDSECVAAALLHDAVEDTPLTFGEVEECFGGEVKAAAAHKQAHAHPRTSAPNAARHTPPPLLTRL